MDLTGAYGKGKSFYIEAYLRDAGTPESVNHGTSMASLSSHVWDKDIVDISAIHNTEYYNYTTDWDPEQPEPWSAAFTSDYTGYEKALERYIQDNNTGLLSKDVPINSSSWTKVSGIIRAEDMATIIDAKNPDDLIGFNILLCCGEYPAQTGYIYYVDNLRIVDLKPTADTGIGVYSGQ